MGTAEEIWDAARKHTRVLKTHQKYLKLKPASLHELRQGNLSVNQ